MKLSGILVAALAIVSEVAAFHTTCTSRNGRDVGSCFSRALPILFSVVDIDENAPRDIQTMVEWAYAYGVQNADGFQLTCEDTSGTGGLGMDVSAMTTQDLPANSPVLWIPSEMILSSNRAVEEFGRLEEAEELIESSNKSDQLRHYYLMLKILVEYERGDESPWYPWLNSLPRYFSNGASMTPFCYKCLPPLVASLAMEERVNLNNLQVKKVPFLSIETKGNPFLWRWAFQIVYTRSFEVNDGSGDLRIVPMGDMFNHGTETEVTLTYDDEGNCCVQTTRDVPAGSPLRMSYGDPTNPSFLFARYGFLDESSPATFCKLMVPHVSDELINLGYAHNRMLFYKDTGDVSQEVWDVLLYQLLSESDVARREEFYQAHMNGDYETKQYLHEQYYPETSVKLLEHLDTFLNHLDELARKTYGRDIKDHPRLPLILRHNDFVKNTFLAVKTRYFE